MFYFTCDRAFTLDLSKVELTVVGAVINERKECLLRPGRRDLVITDTVRRSCPGVLGPAPNQGDSRCP